MVSEEQREKDKENVKEQVKEKSKQVAEKLALMKAKKKAKKESKDKNPKKISNANLRKHRATGNPVGRKKNAFGKSVTTDKLILDQLRSEIDESKREKLSKHSIDVSRFDRCSISYCPHHPRALAESPVVEVPVFQAIVENVARVYKSLPNTPARSAFLAELCRDIPVTKAAAALGVHHSTVSRASEYSDRPFVEFLRQLGFPRKNRADSHEFLKGWLQNDAYCPYPSGSNTRCFVGSPELMWAEYASCSLANSIAPVHSETFHAVRRRESVGIRSGDIFINRDEVELAELRAEIEEDPGLSEQYRDRILELERNLKFCQDRKLYYRNAHQALQGAQKKMLVTLDFTATQTGMADKFTDFVVVVCTDRPLDVPVSLVQSVIDPERPDMLKQVETVRLERKKRRTKKQLADDGEKGRKLLPSWTRDRDSLKKAPQLQKRVLEGNVYKPCSTVFHFVLKRTDDTPGQISPYVQWSMDFLFVKHELGNGFDDIHLFSDGCGKHFKTYPTHWYLADLQQRLRTTRSQPNNNNNNNSSRKRKENSKLRIHWDFLPPGDAHNRCDAAAAHFKRPQKKLIRDFCVLTTVGHLAFACSSLKNCYLIEAECRKFPDALECLIEEPWMQNAFQFDYGVPFLDWKYCGHHGKCKKTCKHACCKKAPKHLPCVIITIKDRENNVSEQVLWLDEAQKADDQLDSLEETEFWNSDSRRRYHSVQGARVSQLNEDDLNTYEYDAVSDCEDCDDDEYCEY